MWRNGGALFKTRIKEPNLDGHFHLIQTIYIKCVCISSTFFSRGVSVFRAPADWGSGCITAGTRTHHNSMSSHPPTGGVKGGLLSVCLTADWVDTWGPCLLVRGGGIARGSGPTFALSPTLHPGPMRREEKDEEATGWERDSGTWLMFDFTLFTNELILAC